MVSFFWIENPCQWMMAPGLLVTVSVLPEVAKVAEMVFVSLFPPQLAVLDRSGNRPAFAPASIMNLWVSKEFSSRWGLGGGARYIGSQYIAEDNALELDSVLTFDATAFYRIGDVRLRLNLKNLILVSKSIRFAAAAREDSRGAHFRADHPETSALERSAYTSARLEGDRLAIAMKPVAFTRVRPGESLLNRGAS